MSKAQPTASSAPTSSTASTRPTTTGIAEVSPMAGAFAIGASTFVAVTGIFVAILAFFTGNQQLDPTGLAQNARIPSSAARWWSYAVGAIVLLNSFYAGARARKNPRVATVTLIIFTTLTIVTSWLYVDTW